MAKTMKLTDIQCHLSDIEKFNKGYTDTFPVYSKRRTLNHPEEVVSAELEVTLRERKVEITEAQFDEAWESLDTLSLAGLKERLFGDGTR